MSNPIFNSFNRPPKTNGPSNNIFGMLSQIRNSQNPDAAMQQMINSNPNLQNIMNYINQNGGDARAAFYNLAAQKGIDPNTILDQLR